MEWQRLVELHDRASGRYGSGYLIAPALVLTARHVVDGLDATRARLLLPDEDGLPGVIGAHVAARVAWRGADGLDLALLCPEAGAPPFREGVGPVAIARLADRAAIRVDALGFPRAMASPAQSDTLQIEAVVSAWTGARGASLLLDVKTVRARTAEDWSGMSGAAVFAGDRLVGVIEAVPGRLDALRATRADLLFDEADAAELLREAQVAFAERTVDAAYVDALPRAGHWGGVRDRYARAVVTTLCRVDHVGLAVGGAPDRRMPALAAFTAQRLRFWS
jgi:hypothetical protein